MTINYEVTNWLRSYVPVQKCLFPVGGVKITSTAVHCLKFKGLMLVFATRSTVICLMWVKGKNGHNTSSNLQKILLNFSLILLAHRSRCADSYALWAYTICSREKFSMNFCMKEKWMFKHVTTLFVRFSIKLNSQRFKHLFLVWA